MSDQGLGQSVKFESLRGDPYALKASLIWVRISPIYTNLETTACGLPSGHSCLPLVCLLITEERGKRLRGKRIFMAIPQNTSILPSRIMDSALLPKSGRLERECQAQCSSSNAAEIRQAARSIRCFRYSNSHRVCWRSRSIMWRIRTEYHSKNRPKAPAGKCAHT